jgi:hypothetical protein
VPLARVIRYLGGLQAPASPVDSQVQSREYKLQTPWVAIAVQSQSSGSSEAEAPSIQLASTQPHFSVATTGPHPTSIAYSQEPVPLQYAVPRLAGSSAGQASFVG